MARRQIGREIHIDLDLDFDDGPAIIIADTGPGFIDDSDDLIRPFFSRRPEGMGVGLYYVNLVMDLCGGALVFPDASEAGVPARFDGAVVTLVFPEEEGLKMFPPPRVVAVDDKLEHLRAILNVFQELGTPCLGLEYNPEYELEKRHFQGVRILFLDLHLVESAPTSDDRRHFAVIASMLSDNISATGGPFILVVWTEHEEEVEGLVAYLDEPSTFPPEAAHAHPMAVVGLPKGRFINLETGNTTRVDALRAEVNDAISKNPQLDALITWERDVLAAAGATLAALQDLVPEDQRTTSRFANGMGEILVRLARAAVGESHVDADPRAAINSGLAPILFDLVANQKTLDDETETWKRAVAAKVEGKLEDTSAARINRMLHVALPRAETIFPTDWGAVVAMPDGWWETDKLEHRFGLTRDQLLDEEFKVREDDRDRCRPTLVRIGAACDYAQQRPGPIPYLLALEVPSGRKSQHKLPASQWASPVLLTDQDFGPFRLVTNARCLLSVRSEDAKYWTPLYRLREQLLMQLISHASTYIARPAIVELRSGR